MTLLDDWYPVTSDMGLIHADVARILGSETFNELFRVEGQVVTSLEDALSALPPLSIEGKRAIWVTTQVGWTAYFASGIQGSDPFSVVRHLALELGVLAMRVCSTPADVLYPANIWEVYAPPELGGDEPLGIRRSITAANDGGRWVFEQCGDPFDFEDMGARVATRKRDRFTREHLASCLSGFGLHPFEEAFYRVETSSPAVLSKRRGEWEDAPGEYTLAEGRDGVPWRC